MIEKLWNTLLNLKKVEHISACQLIPPSYDRREGKGVVNIQKQKECSITIFEKGTWKKIQTQTPIAFTNIFRWTKDSKNRQIHLEHLRFGEENPVYLFALTPIGENLFKSLKPHYCKEDTYFGTLHFDTHFIELNWRIRGPNKNELVKVVYT